MADTKSATDILGVLVLSGLMGMIGQGARTIVGLKKLSDSIDDVPSRADSFEASRIVVGLMIGFVAGVIAGLSLKVQDMTSLDTSLLMGLAAAGYAGTDFIEGFAATIGKVPGAGRHDDATTSARSAMIALPVPTAPAPRDVEVQGANSKPAGRLFGLEREYQEAGAFRDDILSAAVRHSVSLHIVYAVGSRESAWGLTLRPRGPAGTGDWAPRHRQMPPDKLGWGRGLMQADYAASEFAKTGDWRDPTANIEFGCAELAANITFYQRAAHAGVDPIRAGIAAYNCGRGNVDKAIAENKDVDALTTGSDYSRDVLRRAAWFEKRLAEDRTAPALAA